MFGLILLYWASNLTYCKVTFGNCYINPLRLFKLLTLKQSISYIKIKNNFKTFNVYKRPFWIIFPLKYYFFTKDRKETRLLVQLIKDYRVLCKNIGSTLVVNIKTSLLINLKILLWEPLRSLRFNFPKLCITKRICTTKECLKKIVQMCQMWKHGSIR